MKTRRLLFPFMTALVLSLPLGCEEGDDPVAPEENLGAAMVAYASVIEGNLFGQLDLVRNTLNGSVSDLLPFDPYSQGTEEVLAALVSNASDRVAYSGLLEENGVVANVYPEEVDSLLGQPWMDRPGVAPLYEVDGLATGPAVASSEDVRTLPIYRSVAQGGTHFGVLFASVDVDTVIQRSTAFIDFEEIEDIGLFITEETGRVVHAEDRDAFGSYITDAERYGEELATLAATMLDPEHDEEYALYQSDGLPGSGETGGERHVGWTHLQLAGGGFLVIGLTAPVEE